MSLVNVAQSWALRIVGGEFQDPIPPTRARSKASHRGRGLSAAPRDDLPRMGEENMAETGGFSRGKSAIFPCLEPGLLNTSH